MTGTLDIFFTTNSGINMINILYGFLMGLVTATLGAWKDTSFEGFHIGTYFRSPIITAFWYMIINLLTQGNIILIALSSLALERLTVELYKALIRKPPGKFNRPTKDRGWLRDKVKR